MLILSSLTVLIGCVLRVIYKKRVDVTYLGLGILILSMAMIVESRIRQFFLPNSSIASMTGFLLTILVPYPFIVYVSRIQKGRYESVYRVFSLSVVANVLLSTCLQLMNIKDLADTMYISYVIIVAMVIVIAVTIGLDIYKGKIQEYGEVVIGLIAMIIASLWETYVTLVPESKYYGGVALSFGLIILLFMSGIKTAREMLAMEQEKQAAIIAGEAKTKFLANMSHEIRTPINTIIGMNEMILRENHNEAIEEYARSVHNASKLLLGLINDVLDFSKIESGKLDIYEADYHLTKMLGDVIQGSRMKAEAKNLSLNTQIDENLPAVLKGDEIRIRQILNNLLSNAVKYTKQGAVTLTVKGIHTSEEFALYILVEDTGIGIKPEDVDKLFDSFKRLEEQKNRYIEGTGLGLNITRQLVELMGGEIEVKSEYGKGSSFCVKIPQQIVDATVAGKVDAVHRGDSQVINESRAELYAPTATVLVVDDNEMNRAVACALLKRTGIELSTAPGGKECLELCRKSKYDLILMDHMMPDPDGIETLHLLRKDESSLNRDTDVIVLTANAIAGMKEMYLAEGFKEYLTKPIMAEDLEEVLFRCLPKEKIEKGISEALQGKEDSVYINKEIGLRYCSNKEEVYREIISVYCSEGQEYVQKLSQYAAEGNWEQYRIIIHALKGTSRLIGATAFAEKLLKLQERLDKDNQGILPEEHEKLMQEYQTIMKMVKES